MGLTEWKPALKVTVNGKDQTSVFLPRISSIRISDTAGIQSDQCEIELTDHLPLMPLAIPETGAEIQIALGYLFSSQVIGVYIVDEVEVTGPPNRMRITAYAAAHGKSDEGKSAISNARSRSWPDGTTVAKLVGTIAAESGFKASVTEAAGKVGLPHIDQIDESDMNLLTRIARENGLVFKPGGGALIMCQTGESVSGKGTKLPVVALTPKQVTAWSMRITRRGAFAKVIASYRDFGKSEPVEVEADGVPVGVAGVTQVKRLKKIYPTEAAARTAAAAEARRGQRGARTLRLQVPGRADLMAEGRVALAGFREGVAGEWLISEVSHTFSTDGWQSNISAEAPPI
ncbi:phage late control D family protein [Paracoccus litorisediminis]|uniref:phage late control D family protein n=1 Tax=Paracoccus litorisediminis TaxID=2006130 RepID=UPI003731043B